MSFSRVILLAALCVPALALHAAPSTSDPLQFHAGAADAPFSVAVRAGRTLYLSGQIGTRPDGSLPADFDAQAAQTMDNIAATLKGLGVGMDRIAKCTVFIADMKNWARFNAVYTRYFTSGRMPARSAMGANGLALGAALEVECIAELPENVR